MVFLHDATASRSGNHTDPPPLVGARPSAASAMRLRLVRPRVNPRFAVITFALRRASVGKCSRHATFDGRSARCPRTTAEPRLTPALRCGALWAALLWVVIEGFNDRDLQLGGRLADDLAALEPTLKGFRHAVLHVSPRSHHDPRLFKFLGDADNVARISRVSEGMAGLFWHEEEERKREGKLLPD